jgi:hypothetical protein
MSSLRRVAGAGAVVVAAVVLSACTGPQNAPNGGQVTTTATAAAATATTATQAAAPARVTTSAQAAKPVPAKVSACASATKATLEAALEGDEEMSGALVIDDKGLQHINCVAPWAFTHFSNDIDGGRVLFTYRNGTWIPQNAGTGELCEKVPAAIAGQICH